jgi:hypothetical protein
MYEKEKQGNSDDDRRIFLIMIFMIEFELILIRYGNKKADSGS